VGASEVIRQKPNGEKVYGHYALTAGHCFAKGGPVWREALERNQKTGKLEEVDIPIGHVERRAYEQLIAGFETDVEAIRLEGELPPRWIFVSSGYQQRIGAPSAVYTGETVCYSGIYGGSHCGIAGDPVVSYYYEGLPTWQIPVNWVSTEHGDSGGPVWDLQTGAPVGNTTGSFWFTPMLALPSVPNGAAPGMLAAPGMGSLNAVTGS
jgi:hypothetical protein